MAIWVPDFSVGSSQEVRDANANALQAAFNAASPNDIIRLPKEESGPWQCHPDGPINMPVGVKVIGSRQPRLDFYPKTGTTDNFLYSTIESADFEFRNFDIIGPTEVTADKGAIGWVARTSHGSFKVRNVNISGLFSYGLNRSGHGFTSIHGCQINAWEEPINIYEDTEAGISRYEVLRCTLSAVNGKDGASIGMYIHAHIPGLVSGCDFDTFERFGFYRNGGGSQFAFAVMRDCTVSNASIVQSPTMGDTLVTGITTSVGSNGVGSNSVLRGKGTVKDSTFNDQRSFGFFDNNEVRVLDGITTELGHNNLFAATGTQQIYIKNSTLNVAATRNAFTATSTFTGTIYCENVHVYDGGTTVLINIQGGTLDVTNGLTVHTNKTRSEVENYILGRTLGTINIVPL